MSGMDAASKGSDCPRLPMRVTVVRRLLTPRQGAQEWRREMRNRSAPPPSVTPVLSYPDVGAAVDWLTNPFGFVEHVRIGDHRAQLGFGDGALIVADESHGRRAPDSDAVTASVMVRVDDVDDHHERASAAGARVVSPPETHPYGE